MQKSFELHPKDIIRIRVFCEDELMRYQYREDKAVQIAALLLQKEGGSMNYTKLIKLMYVVEQQSIIRWGTPATYDQCYSLPNGPILSHTLDCINGTTYAEDVSEQWHRYIEKLGKYEVRLLDNPGIDSLSRAEIKLIDEVYGDLGHKDYKELIRWSHDKKNVPEWEDPDGSRLPILLNKILEESGYSPEEVEQTIQELNGIEEAIAYFAA